MHALPLEEALDIWLPRGTDGERAEMRGEIEAGWDATCRHVEERLAALAATPRSHPRFAPSVPALLAPARPAGVASLSIVALWSIIGAAVLADVLAFWTRGRFA